MTLERLKVEALRCLASVEIELDPDWNYVLGPNGAGKTSLLESVHLLGRGRSFRTRETARLVQRGQSELVVHGRVDGARIGVSFTEGRLEIRIGGVDGGGSASLARRLPVYVIDPQLHELVEAGPGARRRFLDWGVFHVEHGYLDDWRVYRRLLGQRNAALKRGTRGAELAAWTRALLNSGERVTAARRRYVDVLAPQVAATAERLVGRRIDVEYRPGWRRDLDFAAALAESAAREAELGTTQVGPHRADLKLALDGNVVRDEASRGQQKLIVASLVLGQIDSLQGQGGPRTVLLLDDPAAELDAGALTRLLDEVERRPCQRILTGLSAEATRVRGQASVFHVEQGTLRTVV